MRCDEKRDKRGKYIIFLLDSCSNGCPPLVLQLEQFHLEVSAETTL